MTKNLKQHECEVLEMFLECVRVYKAEFFLPEETLSLILPVVFWFWMDSAKVRSGFDN